MPSHISDHQYGQAVIDSVCHGSHPDSEEVASGDLPQSALSTILELINQAREDVKRSIRRESKDSAPDIDGWISQATQLQENIENSKKISQIIVDQAKQGEVLRNEVNDATQKVELLHGEIGFIQNLTGTLEKIRSLRQVLERGQEAVQSGILSEAVDLLVLAEHKISTPLGSQITKVTGLLHAGVTEFRNDLVEQLKKYWRVFFQADLTTATFSVKRRMQDTSVDIDAIVDAVLKLGLLDYFVKLLYKELDIVILEPRLKPTARNSVRSLLIEQDEIKATEQLTDLSLRRLFSDLRSLVEFLNTRLPASVSTPLSEILVPRLISLLISQWLPASLPTDVKETRGFEGALLLTNDFAELLDSYRWCGKDQLTEWATSIPQVWLQKRCGSSLDKVRLVLAEGFGENEAVERVETQLLSRGDDAFEGTERENDWNADWSDDDEAIKEPGSLDEKEKPTHVEEEEGNAWGFDDDTTDEPSKEDPEVADPGDEETDAWGWQEEVEDDAAGQPAQAFQADSSNSSLNGHPEVHKPATREITLKETYNITALPKQIFEIITQLVYDAETLKSPGYEESPIASIVGELFSLPGLVLSMYRALAPSFYSLNSSGNMFLYNDSLWLAESLRRFTGTQFKKTGLVNPGAAEVEISALETFAKRTYGREMESQRTIIGDLLDGAQGFANCTEAPFAQECDIAISSVVDRLREIYRQWRPVLSHSALLQSVGSLLSTVAKKFIVDIEDMSDISEPESHRLAGFCTRIASLEDLFTPPTSRGTSMEREQAIPLTAVYTPNWLKFQYLANILESSLVDIKYLWTEGELRLEFKAEELVDLVEALFADSDHRRRAIAEIRRSSGRN